MSRIRAIRWCIWFALLTTVLAVPASPKVRPEDPSKGKKTTTPIAPGTGGGVKDSASTVITATTASRPIANATFPHTTPKNATSHPSSSSSAPSSSLATTAAAATMTATAAAASTPRSTPRSTPTSTATAAEIAVTSATTTLKLPTSSPIVTVTTPSLASTAALTATNTTSGDLDAGVTGSSSTFTETSPRIIAPTQNTATVLSRKSTAAAAAAAAAAAVATDVTTTAPLTSAKETRESPGKIRPQIKLTTNYTSETGVRLPEGASAALAKPTKYHYYPHNQHIYLLPECAVQQVCNAVYVRLNFTQPLCACPGRYRDPCSASLDSDDLHTTELVTDPRTKALTLVKTCEPVAEMRECRASRDWSLLALQNVRTGKSHYLVICRCPDTNILGHDILDNMTSFKERHEFVNDYLTIGGRDRRAKVKPSTKKHVTVTFDVSHYSAEGPMSHDQPTYASVPGIRVYGMMCVQGNRRGRPLRYSRSVSEYTEGEEKPRFPWHKVRQLMATSLWE